MEYRELLYRMTARDLLQRYKQITSGVGSAIFMPLLNVAILTVVFTTVAPIDTGLLAVWMFATSVVYSIERVGVAAWGDPEAEPDDASH